MPDQAFAGDSVSLQATLKTKDNALANKSIVFSADGDVLPGAQTNDAGVASVQYTIPPGHPEGPISVIALFENDNLYGSSVGANVLTVVRYATTMEVDSASGYVGDTLTLTAHLRETTGLGIEGKTVHFRVGTTVVGDATTSGTDGAATIQYTI